MDLITLFKLHLQRTSNFILIFRIILDLRVRDEATDYVMNLEVSSENILVDGYFKQILFIYIICA